MKAIVSCTICTTNNISSKLRRSIELGKSVHLLFLGQSTEYFWCQRASSHVLLFHPSEERVLRPMPAQAIQAFDQSPTYQ